MSDGVSTWIQHEAGWYTLRGVGGICREKDGWAFWPLHGEPIRGSSSLRDAKMVAEAERRRRVSDLAEAIVAVVLADLMDRKSVKWPLQELENDEPGMFVRLRWELQEKVGAVLRGEV